MIEIADHLKEPFVELLLSVADDKLILGHRNSDWTGLAPILEEDIAFSSLAQDEIAHAQALYELAAPLTRRSADDLVFGRGPGEYRCCGIVELPDDFDWAFAVCRRFFCDHFDALRLGRMARSSLTPLADLAGRLAAEEQIHVEHADAWIERLGRGGDDARRRMQEALDRLSPIAPALLEPTDGLESLESEGVYPPPDRVPFELWSAGLAAVTDASGLTLDLKPPAPGHTGGGRSTHTPHLERLLDEMCEVYRLEPGAAW